MDWTDNDVQHRLYRAYEQDSLGNNRLTGYSIFIGVTFSLYRTCDIEGQMELIEKVY